MARKPTQGLGETLVALAQNALDDIRHKVVEQGWSGQEQTGYLQSPYGNANDHPAPSTRDQQQAAWWRGETGEPATQADSLSENAAVSHEIHRPTEDPSWWRGEHSGSYDGSEDTHRNGWGIGQDAWETRQEMEAEQILEK